MAIKDKLKRIQKAMQGQLTYIELADGSTFYFDPEETTKEMFLFFSESLDAVYRGEERPEPPQIVHAIAAARDREQAFRTVFPEGASFFVLDERALIEHGKIVKRRISTSEKLDVAVVEDCPE
jgi:hypothetical protein